MPSLSKLISILSVCLAGVLAGAQEPTSPNSAWFDASDSNLQYSGRVGFEKPGCANFYYAASGFRTKFSGRSLALRFEEDNYGPANSFGVRIDGGAEIPVCLEAGKDRNYVVAVGLSRHVHTLEVYRRQDTYGGVATFKGIWLEKGNRLEMPAPKSKRRIEFFGDSVTAGAASMGVGYEAKPDSVVDYDSRDGFLNNGYWGFAAITARLLKVDANIEGIGGLPLLDHTGWYGGGLDKSIGLETTWDKLNPILGQLSDWDFARFTPHLVVIAIGQNDAHGGDIGNANWRQKWEERYARLLDDLRGHYPNAVFVLTTTILGHDLAWDRAIQEVASIYSAEHRESKVRFFQFKRAGRGTPGHPRVEEQEEMAKELSAYIEKLPVDWNRSL